MSAANKKVHWAQLEKYLSLHQLSLVTFVDLQKNDLMDIPSIESRLPKSFLQLHEALTKILKENDILPNEEEQKVDQLSLIVKTVMKLQSTLLTQNTTNQEEIKCVIRQMKPQLADIFGTALQEEVATLLENLAGMTDVIEANFAQIKDIL